MAKLKRIASIFEEGSLKAIYKLFISPLTIYKPDTKHLSTFHEELFGVDRMQFHSYRVRTAFTLPGLLYLRPLVKVQGIGYRDVKVDQELLVRLDVTKQDQIDVEYFGGPGDTEQVFQLTNHEWSRIRPFLDKL